MIIDTNVFENLTEFKDFISKETEPVLVDFNAKWCGPCKVLGPVLEETIKSYKRLWRITPGLTFKGLNF